VEKTLLVFEREHGVRVGDVVEEVGRLVERVQRVTQGGNEPGEVTWVGLPEMGWGSRVEK